MRRLFSVTQYQYVITVAQAARERDAALGASGSAYSQAVAEATQKRDSLDNEAGRSVIQAKNAVTEAENATDIEEGQAKADEVSDADEVVDRVTEPNPSESDTTVTVDYGKQHDLR